MDLILGEDHSLGEEALVGEFGLGAVGGGGAGLGGGTGFGGGVGEARGVLVGQVLKGFFYFDFLWPSCTLPSLYTILPPNGPFTRQLAAAYPTRLNSIQTHEVLLLYAALLSLSHYTVLLLGCTLLWKVHLLMFINRWRFTWRITIRMYTDFPINTITCLLVTCNMLLLLCFFLRLLLLLLIKLWILLLLMWGEVMMVLGLVGLQMVGFDHGTGVGIGWVGSTLGWDLETLKQVLRETVVWRAALENIDAVLLDYFDLLNRHISGVDLHLLLGLLEVNLLWFE